MRPDDWLPFPDDPGARLRLVCCAHSGAGVAAFARWRRQLPAGVSLCPVRRPGRESALRQPLLSSVDALVDGVFGALRTRPRLPMVLLGNSLGAAVAYEAARRLQTAGQPPRLLIAAGRHAPRHPLDFKASHLPDDAFIDAIDRRYGGIPAIVRQEPELLAMMLPALRADLAAAERWRARPEPRWAGSTWICVGDSDRSLKPGLVDDWAGDVDGPVQIDRIPGDHFALLDPQSGFFDQLSARLKALLAEQS